MKFACFRRYVVKNNPAWVRKMLTSDNKISVDGKDEVGNENIMKTEVLNQDESIIVRKNGLDFLKAREKFKSGGQNWVSKVRPMNS